MPNIKSAKKRVKVIKVKTLQNQMAKSALKTTLKSLTLLLQAAIRLLHRLRTRLLSRRSTRLPQSISCTRTRLPIARAR